MKAAAKNVCGHLKPFLRELRDEGSVVVRVDEDAWSNCVLNVVLDRGPEIERARELFELPPQVRLWSNDDPHYEIENGLSCEMCKHALSWPRPEKLPPTARGER